MLADFSIGQLSANLLIYGIDLLSVYVIGTEWLILYCFTGNALRVQFSNSIVAQFLL